MANSQPLDTLETKMNDVFGRQAPPLPQNARDAMVKYAPWASIILGILSLWGALTLWRWAHAVSDLVDYSNRYLSLYGGQAVTNDHMSLWIWVGLVVLAVEGVLYLLAYPGLRDRKKAGWNYLYWGALLNLAYAVVSLFTDYGYGTVVGTLISSAIGFWLLFQIRSAYMGAAPTPKTAAPSATAHTSKKARLKPEATADKTDEV